MVEGLDTVRGAYLDISTRAQLRAAYQQQPIFDLCTVDGVNGKKPYKTSFTRPQNVYPAYPATNSKGLIKDSWLSHKQSWLKESTREWVLTLTRQQGLSYAWRTKDNPFCATVWSNL